MLPFLSYPPQTLMSAGMRAIAATRQAVNLCRVLHRLCEFPDPSLESKFAYAMSTDAI
jgi:hypothetical protein